MSVSTPGARDAAGTAPGSVDDKTAVPAAAVDVPAAIWLVTDVYPPGCGGSGWSTHALAQTLAARGHDVEVICLDPGARGVSQRVFEGIRVSELGVRRARRNPARRLGARDYAHRALEAYLTARLAAAPEVELLHAQHLHSGPPTIAAAMRCGRGAVQTLRDYWPVCLHGTSFWNGAECPGCSTSDLTGCMSEYWRWPRPLARLMVPWARRRLAERRAGVEAAGRVIAVSDWVRRRIERETTTARFSVLPNIVDGAATRAAAEAAAPLDLPCDDFLVAAGKLVETKGFASMLSALAGAGCRLPVVIAGAGPQRDLLRRQAADLGLDLHLPGWVAHPTLLRLIASARGFLLPGTWNEPLSRLLLEALALGIPVVAWPSGGNTEHLEAGVDALVVEDTEQLRAALAVLDDPQRARALGAAGAELARRSFSPEAVYPQLIAAYREALAAQPAAGEENAAVAGPAR
ncbi:MAG: glycosyltransferase family 4 protein [Acidobacteriota bacterium]|jgi:glycosyltransferase involved in cell wall biosynthesis